MAVERHLFSECHNPLCSDRPCLPHASSCIWSPGDVYGAYCFAGPVGHYKTAHTSTARFAFSASRSALSAFAASGNPSDRSACHSAFSRCAIAVFAKFSLTFCLLTFSICFRCASLSFSLLFSLTPAFSRFVFQPALLTIRIQLRCAVFRINMIDNIRRGPGII